MSNRNFVDKMLGERWLVTASSASVLAATTVTVNTSSAKPRLEPQERPHLETLWYAVRNVSGAGALVHTTTLEVRSASIAGTLLATVKDIYCLPSQTANVAATRLGIPGKRGQHLNISFNTVLASVTASINASGWIENS